MASFSSPIVTNSVFWGNSDSSGTGEAAQIYDGGSSVTVVTYSDVQGGWTGAGGTGNINADPLFVDADGADDTVGTEDDNVRLNAASSPAVDVGSNADIPADITDIDGDGDTTEELPWDLDSWARTSDPTCDDVTVTVDMGAYEASFTPLALAGNDDGSDKNRFLSFIADQATELTMLRVTLTDSEDFPAAVGLQWWIAAPQEYCELGGVSDPAQCGSNPTFWAAPLECPQPGAAYWNTWGVVHAYGADVVPNATYEIQAVHQGCDAGDEASFSSPLVVTTPMWGDLVGIFDVTLGIWTPPDGEVDITNDMAAVQDKYGSLPNAPIKTRCDLDPEVPEFKIQIIDIVRVIDASSGLPYPFNGPTTCP